ncbi:hypothetical protein IB237_06080 [Agrobacterium sp. AGB01]|uniref:hypothetical protein n=1 Tax=Agrobacterium sp. AGB01 TaxID=2769302 RepID=UPI00178509D7|nr:hypothetical protein [Agrobacterium sp. AGB01]MBD9386734.1 hypothetical protein [Agrobacterium sp. AGB01]
MFEKHEIWRHTEEAVLRHLIFRDITTNLYYLQQTDSLYANGSKETAESAALHLSIAVELFIEVIPSSKDGGRAFKTLAEAADSWND